MITRRAYLATAVLAVTVIVWFLWPPHVGDESSSARATAATPSSQEGRATSPLPAPPPPPLEVSDLARDLNSSANDIRADLRILLEVIESFRTNFPKDGNPVGSNAEITATLAGRNRLRLALIPPNHPAINSDGELCDRWGTPFFFHAESATRMEVRSAGPDRRMWTVDDVVLTP